MKGLKDLRILDTQYFVDGKFVGNVVPKSGKVVFCKIKCDYITSMGNSTIDWIYGEGKAELHEDDTFDYNKGKDIAFARAIKDVIIQVENIEIKLFDMICNRIQLTGNIFDKYDDKLITLGAKKS